MMAIPSLPQSHVRINAQRERSSLALESIVKAPILAAVRHHLEVKPPGVGELKGAPQRLGTANLAICQHLTVSPTVTSADTVSGTDISLRQGESLGNSVSARNPKIPGTYGSFDTA